MLTAQICENCFQNNWMEGSEMTDWHQGWLTAMELLDAGEFDAAISKFQWLQASFESETLNSDNPDQLRPIMLLSKLGEAYQKKGMNVEAESIYKKVIAVCSQGVLPHFDNNNATGYPELDNTVNMLRSSLDKRMSRFWQIKAKDYLKACIENYKVILQQQGRTEEVDGLEMSFDHFCQQNKIQQ